MNRFVKVYSLQSNLLLYHGEQSYSCNRCYQKWTKLRMSFCCCLHCLMK